MVFKYSPFAQISALSLAFALTALIVTTAWAQRADPKDPQNVARGVELLKQAIAARGGDKYLKFKSLEAIGQFTPFDQGISTVPKRFLDWIVYPDRERTEFGKGKKKDRYIQVNVGATGWVYDGEAEVLRDQTTKQIDDFQEGIEYDLDHILRTGWQKEGAQVRFYGREELRPGERADVVEIKLDDNKTAYLMLDRYTHLPMSLSYEKPDGKSIMKREVRYFQYINYDGIKFPNIVDFYRNSVQESRINYESIRTDVPVADELFVKPASIKLIK